MATRGQIIAGLTLLGTFISAVAAAYTIYMESAEIQRLKTELALKR
ncbi:hypothetical protein ES702_00757 [subsurface metagenome]